MPCPPHPLSLDVPNYILGSVLIEKLRVVHLHSPVTASLLGPNSLLRTLFSDILSLCYIRMDVFQIFGH
jgi:hypothetical protein